MRQDQRRVPFPRGRRAAIAVMILLVAALVDGPARPAMAGDAALLFSLSVEHASPPPAKTEPIHAAGLILRDAESGALTRRVTLDPRQPDAARVAPLGDGALFLLAVPPGRYHPRQFDVRVTPSRGASGPICCPTAVEARAGEITYIGAITLTVRTTRDGAVGSVTFHLVDESDRDIAHYEAATPDALPVAEAVAAHPPVTRYVGDGRFRE